MGTRIARFSRQLLDVVYPGTCVLCGAASNTDRDLCADCLAELPLLGPCCKRCALPFPVAEADRSGVAGTPRRTTLCGNCQRHPPPYQAAFAAFRYEDPLPALVAGIKFRSRLNLIRLLGALLAGALAREAQTPHWMPPDVMVPVPLHPRRLRQRGYNQALELARPIARRLDIPVHPELCQRVRSTQAQSELDERSRLSNIRGAFRATGPLPPRIAVLDDVVTTGATVSEMARVLRAAGCRQVAVWSLARTP